VRVTRQVGQHRFRSAERTLGVSHPFDLAQTGHPGRESLEFGERCMTVEELQTVGLVAAISISRNSRR